MEFPWSALQQHEGKQISAARALIEKRETQGEPHDHSARPYVARLQAHAMPSEEFEPPARDLLISCDLVQTHGRSSYECAGLRSDEMGSMRMGGW